MNKYLELYYNQLRFKSSEEVFYGIILTLVTKEKELYTKFRPLKYLMRKTSIIFLMDHVIYFVSIV